MRVYKNMLLLAAVLMYLLLGFLLNMRSENSKIKEYKGFNAFAWKEPWSYGRSFIFSAWWPYFVIGNMHVCGRILECK